jgi:hypothetical protein
MISRPAFSPADELQRCVEMLVKYWILAVPPALASLAIVLVTFATLLTLIGSTVAGALLGGNQHAGEGAGAGFGFAALLGLAGVMLGFVALNVSQAVTMHASLDAYADRTPDLQGSLRAVLPRLGDLSVSMLLCFLLLIVPAVLSLVLIGIPFLIVAGYFLIYVQAAVVLGGETAADAIGTSIRIGRTHVGHTLVLVLGAIAALIVGSVVNGIAVHLPLVNVVVGFVVGGFTSAFVAMASARFYVVLRDAPREPGFRAVPPPIAPDSAAADGFGGGPTIIR